MAARVQKMKEVPCQPMTWAIQPVGRAGQHPGHSDEAGEQSVLGGGEAPVGKAGHEGQKSGGAHARGEVLKGDYRRQARDDGAPGRPTRRSPRCSRPVTHRKSTNNGVCPALRMMMPPSRPPAMVAQKPKSLTTAPISVLLKTQGPGRKGVVMVEAMESPILYTAARRPTGPGPRSAGSTPQRAPPPLP